MAKVLCVLYADPVDGYPTSYPRDDLPKLERYPDGQTLPTPKAIDFQPGALLGSVSGELGLRTYLESNGHTLVVTVGQGRRRFGARPRAGRCRDRHLAALLAGLYDRRADRQGEEPQDDRHRRDRLGPYRPPGGDGRGHHRRRGHLLQLDLGRRACRDDDPVAGPELSALAPGGARRRLEHRRLRRALLRRRGHACRHRRGGADRARRAEAAEAVRHAPPLLRPAPAPGRGRAGAGPDLARQRRGHGRRSATW